MKKGLFRKYFILSAFLCVTHSEFSFAQYEMRLPEAFGGSKSSSIGDIYVAGYCQLSSSPNGPSDMFVARINKNDGLDSSFSSDGYVKFSKSPAQTRFRPSYIKVHENNKIVIASSTFNYPANFSTPGDYAFEIRSLNQDGSMDTSFADNGFFEDRSTTQIIGYDAISSDDDSSLYAVGIKGVPVNGEFAIAKYNLSNSQIDNSFANNGYKYPSSEVSEISYHDLSVTRTATSSSLSHIKISSTGSLIAAGVGYFPGITPGTKAIFTKFSADGSFDSSLDGNGIQVVPTTSQFGSNRMSNAEGFDIFDDESMIVASATGPTIHVLKMTPQGSPDISFAGGYGAMTITGGCSNGNVRQVLVDSNNNTLIVAHRPYRLIRLGPNGSISAATIQDPAGRTFDNPSSPSEQGEFASGCTSSGFNLKIEKIQVLGNGKIIGIANHYLRDEQAVFMLNEDGTLDTSFGDGDGVSLYNVGSECRGTHLFVSELN